MTKQYTHSPFYIVEDFISPALCENIIAEFGISVPSLDKDDKPIKHERVLGGTQFGNNVENFLFEHVAEIQTKFRGITHGMVDPIFQQYFENPKDPCEPHGCESSKHLRKKWVKHKDVDLVGFIWLKDYNNGVPLDPRFEVYGGKLEFPMYDFSLVPQRGTLVLFPAGPHFITAISPVLVGSLEQIKFSIKLTQADGGLWLYQPEQFPYNETALSWFNQ